MKTSPSRAKLTEVGSEGGQGERSAGEPVEGVEIAEAGRLDHAHRERGTRGLAIPPAGTPFGVQIVAQGLLVEARLRTAGLIAVRRPEARAVGGEHFVDQADCAVAIAAELELR